MTDLPLWSSAHVVLGALAIIWLSLTAYVLLTRALYDFRQLAFIGARRIVEQRVSRAASADERARALRRLPRRTLAGIASDAHMDRDTTAAAARVLLERRWPRILRRAARHRNEPEKWTRIASLRIFAAAGWWITWPLLADALRARDDDVVAAAVALLGERDDPRATDLLVTALIHDLHPRSRIATYLEGRDLGDGLLEMTNHHDEEVRYWAAALLRPRTPDEELVLASLAGDPMPTVRAAVAKSFAAVGGAEAASIGKALLTDPVWFVRAQAARAIGAGGYPELAERLTPLLREDEWWVRAAAKEALAELGPAAAPLLVEMLHDDDRFARNGAAEVLFETGAVDEWLDDPGRTDAVISVLAAGGDTVRQAAVRKARGPAGARLAELLAEPA